MPQQMGLMKLNPSFSHSRKCPISSRGRRRFEDPSSGAKLTSWMLGSSNRPSRRRPSPSRVPDGASETLAPLSLVIHEIRPDPNRPRGRFGGPSGPAFNHEDIGVGIQFAGQMRKTLAA
jgi:hypothetical protein